jgi:hypothetical protein
MQIGALKEDVISYIEEETSSTPIEDDVQPILRRFPSIDMEARNQNSSQVMQPIALLAI